MPADPTSSPPALIRSTVRSSLLRWWDDLDAEARAAWPPRSNRSTSTRSTPCSTSSSARGRPLASIGSSPRRGRPPPPDRRRARGPPPRRRDRRGRPGRRRGRRRDRRRGLGHPTRVRGPQGDLSDRPGLGREPLPGPRREGRRPLATPRPDDPALHHDQPREPRDHRPVLRGERQLRPPPRPVLRPGADAGGRPRVGQDPPGRERPRRPQPRRPRRDALRPGWGPVSEGSSELPGRDARPWGSGRSSTSRSTTRWSGSPTRRSSASTARPRPRCRSR